MSCGFSGPSMCAARAELGILWGFFWACRQPFEILGGCADGDRGGCRRSPALGARNCGWRLIALASAHTLGSRAQSGVRPRPSADARQRSLGTSRGGKKRVHHIRPELVHSCGLSALDNRPPLASNRLHASPNSGVRWGRNSESGVAVSARRTLLMAVQTLLNLASLTATSETVAADLKVVRCQRTDFNGKCAPFRRSLNEDAIRRAAGLEKEEFCQRLSPKECEDGYNEFLWTRKLLPKGQRFFANSSFEQSMDARALAWCGPADGGSPSEYCWRIRMRAASLKRQEIQAFAKLQEHACGATASRLRNSNDAWFATMRSGLAVAQPTFGKRVDSQQVERLEEFAVRLRKSQRVLADRLEQITGCATQAAPRLESNAFSTAQPEDLSTSRWTNRCLAKDAIAKVVRGRAAAVRGCLENVELAAPGLTASLMISWRILPDGSVDDARAVQEEPKYPALTQCVLEIFRKLRFTKPNDGECVVEWPLRFDTAP